MSDRADEILRAVGFERTKLGADWWVLSIRHALHFHGGYELDDQEMKAHLLSSIRAAKRELDRHIDDLLARLGEI